MALKLQTSLTNRPGRREPYTKTFAAIRFFLFLCPLCLAGHFLRIQQPWLATAAALPILAAIRSTLIPRSLLLLYFIGSTAFWMQLTASFIIFRLETSSPWLFATCILSTVCLSCTWASVTLYLQKNVFRENWGETAAVLFTAILLFVSTEKALFPLLLGERFWPDSRTFWILFFSLYAGKIFLFLQKNSRKTRPRIWRFFSTIFFLQATLGLVGIPNMLMTGHLHLPIPALILAGPLFRGDGNLFMPILFLCTLIFTGPAWCSHLCYAGAWDEYLAKQKIRPTQRLPRFFLRLRWGIFLLTIILPIALHLWGISVHSAFILALCFGTVSIAFSFGLSRHYGLLMHCTFWCPLGVVATMFGRLSIWKIQILPHCTQCGVCKTSCRYHALTTKALRKHRVEKNCTLCSDCLTACPHNALKFSCCNQIGGRNVFLIFIASFHSIFLAVARI